MTNKVIEYPSRGISYLHPHYGVYEYGVYPRSSVLAGQTSRRFLDSFPTLEEAQAAHPDAEWYGEGTGGPQPVALPPEDPDELGDLEQYERECLREEMDDD